MELIFRIAKHYWLDGENATWSVSETFDQNALDWFKNQYSLLEDKRLCFRESQNRTSFFFYSDTQDVYGRNITEIVATFVDVLFKSPESVQERISDRLTKLRPADLEFTLAIDDSDIINSGAATHLKPANHRRTLRLTWIPAALVAFLVLVGIMVVILFYSQYEPIAGLEQSVPQSDNGQNSDRVSGVNKKASALSIDNRTNSQYSKESVRDDFCKNFEEIDANYQEEERLRHSKCFSSYIKEQCSIQDRMPYNKWLENGSRSDACKNVNTQQSDKDLDAWKEVHSVHENLIENFFSGKKRR